MVYVICVLHKLITVQGRQDMEEVIFLNKTIAPKALGHLHKLVIYMSNEYG